MNYNKKSVEGKFQNKVQTTLSRTESTIRTNTGKTINRKFISGPLFQTERKSRKEPAVNATGEINPKTDTAYADWTGSMAAGMKFFGTF